MIHICKEGIAYPKQVIFLLSNNPSVLSLNHRQGVLTPSRKLFETLSPLYVHYQPFLSYKHAYRRF